MLAAGPTLHPSSRVNDVIRRVCLRYQGKLVLPPETVATVYSLQRCTRARLA